MKAILINVKKKIASTVGKSLRYIGIESFFASKTKIAHLPLAILILIYEKMFWFLALPSLRKHNPGRQFFKKELLLNFGDMFYMTVLFARISGPYKGLSDEYYKDLMMKYDKYKEQADCESRQDFCNWLCGIELEERLIPYYEIYVNLLDESIPKPNSYYYIIFIGSLILVLTILLIYLCLFI